MSPDEATWEDADFIKVTFPEFFNSTIRSWFPTPDPRGQGSSPEEGSCQDPDRLYMLSEERDTGDTSSEETEFSFWESDGWDQTS